MRYASVRTPRDTVKLLGHRCNQLCVLTLVHMLNATRLGRPEQSRGGHLMLSALEARRCPRRHTDSASGSMLVTQSAYEHRFGGAGGARWSSVRVSFHVERRSSSSRSRRSRPRPRTRSRSSPRGCPTTSTCSLIYTGDDTSWTDFKNTFPTIPLPVPTASKAVDGSESHAVVMRRLLPPR